MEVILFLSLACSITFVNSLKILNVFIKLIITLYKCTREKNKVEQEPRINHAKCHIARFPTELLPMRIRTCSFIMALSLWLNIKGKRQCDRFKRYCLQHWWLYINTSSFCILIFFHVHVVYCFLEFLIQSYFFIWIIFIF